MHTGTREQPFRVQLIFYDELKSVQAVPLNGIPSPIGDEGVGGMLHGKEDVASFISDIGIDSIVQTRQLSEQPLVLERIFHTLPPSQIISAIEEGFGARCEVDVKILEGQPLTERDHATLSYFECVVLGSTGLRSTEGFCRMREWFRRQPKSTG